MPDGRPHAPSLPGGRFPTLSATSGAFSPRAPTPTRSSPQPSVGPVQEDIDRVQRRLQYAKDLRAALLATAGKPLVAPAVGPGGLRPQNVLESIRARGKGGYPGRAEDLRQVRGFERRELIIELLNDEESFNDDKFFAKTVDVLSPLEQWFVFRAWEGANQEELAVIDEQIIKDYQVRGDVQDLNDRDQPFLEKALGLKSALVVNKPFTKLTRGLGGRIAKIPFVGEKAAKGFVAGSPSILFEKLGDKVLSDKERAQPSMIEFSLADAMSGIQPYTNFVRPISETAEKIPFIGPSLKREIDFAPITLPLTVFGPTRLMLAGITGSVLAGGTARIFTDDEKIVTGAEIAGGFAPFAPSAIRGTLSTYRRFRPFETPIDLPIAKGSTIRFSRTKITTQEATELTNLRSITRTLTKDEKVRVKALETVRPKGVFNVVSENKFGLVVKAQGKKDTKAITRVHPDELINIIRSSRKPKYLLSDDLRVMAKTQEEFGRPDTAALYLRAAERMSISKEEMSTLATLRKISRDLTDNESRQLLTLEAKEGQVISVQGGQALAGARLLKQQEAVEGARDALKATADEVPGVWEIQVEHGWAVLMGLRDDFGRSGAYENVDAFLRNSDDIMIRLPVTGELVPASQIQWIPAKGELTDMMISMPKSLQVADVPPNIMKMLLAAEKQIPTEITKPMRKVARDYGIPLQPKTTPRELLEQIRDMFASVEVVSGAPLKRGATGGATGIDNLQLPRQVTELIVGGGREERATLAPKFLKAIRAQLGDEVADDVVRGLEVIHAIDPVKTIVLGRKGGRLITGHAVGETTEGFVPSRVTEEAGNILTRIDNGESVTSRTFGYNIQDLRRVAEENGFPAVGLKKGEIIDELVRRGKGLEGIKQDATISVRRLIMSDEDMRGMGISERVGEILGLKGGQRRVIQIPTKSATRLTPDDFERSALAEGGNLVGRMPIDKHTMMLFPTRKGAALAPEELDELKDLRTFLRKDMTKEQKARITQLTGKEGAFTTTELESRIATTKTSLLSSIRARSGIERRQVTGKPGSKVHDAQLQSRIDQNNDRIRLGILEGYGDVVPDKKLSAELMEEIAENKRVLTEIDDGLDRIFTPMPKGASRGAYEEDLKQELVNSQDMDGLDAVLRREAEHMRVAMNDQEHTIAALTKTSGKPGGLSMTQEKLYADLQKQKEFYLELGLHKDLTTDRLESIFQNLGIRHILGSAVGYVPLPLTPKSHLFDQLAKSHLYQSIVEPRNLQLASRFHGTLENGKLVAATDFGPITNAMGDIARLSLGKPRMGRAKAISEWAARRFIGKNLGLTAFIKKLESVPKRFKPTREAAEFSDTPEGSFRRTMATLLKDMRSKYGEGYAEEVRSALYESHFNIFTMLQDPTFFKPDKAMKFWLGAYQAKMGEWTSVANTQGITPNVFQKMFRQLFDEKALGILGKNEPGEVAAKRLKEQNLGGTLTEFFTWAHDSAPRRKLGGVLGHRPPEEFLAPAEGVFLAQPYAIGEGIASKAFIGWAKEMGVSVKMSLFGMELAETQRVGTGAVTKVTTEEFKEFGALLRHLDIPGPGQTPLGGLDEIFAQAARSKLILDLSFFTVQGNLALVAKTTGNPQGIGKAIKELLTVTHSDTAYVHWLTANAPRLAMNNNAGLSVGLPAVVGGQFRKNWIFENSFFTPLVSKPAGAFREWNDRLFERGLLVLKTNMIDDLMEDLKMFSKLPEQTQGDWAKRIPFFSDIENLLGSVVRKKSPLENHEAIVRLVNDMLTGSKAPITSTRAFYERALFLTPNFFRAQLQWHVKALQPWTLEGFFAARMLIKNYAFWSTLGQLLSHAAGEPEKFNYTKPWRADFLGVRIPGGGYIPVFPSRAVQTITARILKGAFDKDAKQVGYWSETFLEGRASPVASAAWESLRQEDFLGRKYPNKWEYFWTWGKQALPISLESTIDSFREAYAGHPGYSDDPATALLEIAGQTAIDVTGRSMNPANPIEELDRIVNTAAKAGVLTDLAGDKVPKWFDLEQAEQLEIIAQYPDAQKWSDIQEFNQRSRASSSEQRNTEDFDQIRTARERAYTLPIDVAFTAGNATLKAGQYKFDDIEQMWNEQIITGDEFRDFMKATENTARGDSRVAVARLERNGIDFEVDRVEEIADKTSGDRGSTLFSLALLQYNELQPSDVTQVLEVGGQKIDVVDWEQFQTDRDAILAQFPDDVQESVIAWSRRLEETKPIIKERREAGELITKWYEIPRYRGLSVKQGEFVDIMRREIAERYNAARDRFPVDISTDDSQALRTALMTRMVNGGNYSTEQKRLAIIGLLMENSRGLSQSLSNPERISFILANPGMLMWYDFLFKEVPRPLRNLLPPELQARYDEETLSDAVSDQGLLPSSTN